MPQNTVITNVSLCDPFLRHTTLSTPNGVDTFVRNCGANTDIRAKRKGKLCKYHQG